MSQGWGMSQGEAGNDEEGEADGVHVLWPTPDAAGATTNGWHASAAHFRAADAVSVSVVEVCDPV